MWKDKDENLKKEKIKSNENRMKKLKAKERKYQIQRFVEF